MKNGRDDMKSMVLKEMSKKYGDYAVAYELNKILNREKIKRESKKSLDVKK